MSGRHAVAQTCSLLYRRCETCGRRDAERCLADCKSTIRSRVTLRHGRGVRLAPRASRLCVFLGFWVVFFLAVGSLSAQSADTNTPVRFHAVDIFVDSEETPLAAYQLEFAATNGNAKIVGIEGGTHPAFSQPPFYDPKAMQHERVILAAFSTEAADKLPKGKTRVATIHIQVSGKMESDFEIKLQAAADANGKTLQAKVTAEVRKPT